MKAAIFRGGDIVVDDGAGAGAGGGAGAGQDAGLRHLRLGPARRQARPSHGRAVAKRMPGRMPMDLVARRRVRPRVLLRGARLRSEDRAQAEARHAGLLHAGDARGRRRRKGMGYSNDLSRRLCRADGAGGAADAGSAERPVDRACRAHRAAGRRRPCGREGGAARATRRRWSWAAARSASPSSRRCA